MSEKDNTITFWLFNEQLSQTNWKVRFYIILGRRDVQYIMYRYFDLKSQNNSCSAEIELIDETIEKDDEEIKGLETLQEIVKWPEMYPFKEYTVACLVLRFTNSRLLFLSNEVNELKMGKADFETLIDRLGSAQLGQLGLTKEYCYSLI